MQCQICLKEIQRPRRHIAGKHKILIKDYYDQYCKKENEGFCKNCGKETEFYPRFFKYKEWCEISCFTKSLWKDSKFIEAQQIGASKKMKETNTKLWRDPEFRKRHAKRSGERLSAFNKRRWVEDREEMLDHVSRNGVKTVQRGYGYEYSRDVYYKDIKMRSSWETSFAQQLDEKNITWEHEPKVFVIGHAKRYIPDFYLPHLDLYVEIKPACFVTEKVLEKLKGMEERGHSISLVTEDSWEEFLEKV